MLTVVETNLGEPFRKIIERLFTQLQQQSLITTLAGLLGLVYTASKLFRHLRMTFRAIWKYEPPLVAGPMSERVTTTVREYAVAFFMVLSGGLWLVLAFVLLSVTQRLVDCSSCCRWSIRSRRDCSRCRLPLRSSGAHLPCSFGSSRQSALDGVTCGWLASCARASGLLARSS